MPPSRRGSAPPYCSISLLFSNCFQPNHRPPQQIGGVFVEVDVTNQVRADFARAAQEHRAQVQAAFRGCAGSVMSLRTDRDWVADTVRFVGQRRRAAGVR